jgi:ribosomal protein S18 acetylase RimI-like enzyme
MQKTRTVENRHTEPLEAAGFDVREGWSDEVAEGLVAGAREDEMRRWVPRDLAERFSDTDAANEWYERNHKRIYALAQRATLTGVIWYSPNSRPDLGADYTFAIRMYEQARGRGLARAFMVAAQRDFAAVERYEGAIWLETDADNTHARRLYEQSGYTLVSEQSDRVTMVRNP